MDLFELKNFSIAGLTSMTPNTLADLSAWCRDWCEETGDGRYCVLSQAFEAMSDWWSEHDEHGGIPKPLAVQIDSCIRNGLPEVIDESKLDVATHLASVLRDELLAILIPVESWIEQGYMRRGNN